MSVEEIGVVLGIGAVLCIILLTVIFLVRRHSDKAMLRAMTGEERYRMTGRVQIGHKPRYDGYVAFCDDGLVVHTKAGEVFAPYRKTRDVSVQEHSIRFVADGVGSVIIKSEREVPMDKQMTVLRLFEIMP